MHAFQDYYPENVAHCYGCGRLNEHGHQIKTFWRATRPSPASTRSPSTRRFPASSMAA